MIENSVVLVTGASGFTGRYLCASLHKAGAQVIELSDRHSDLPNTFQCDITDKAQLNSVIAEINPDFVVHLAAISFVATKNVDAFYRVNVIGTCNLLEALSNCDAKKIVIASSANIYGQVAGGDPIAENQRPSPTNHYATSKLAMEYMVRTYFEKLPIIITRPFNYTGPGQEENFLVPKIVAHYSAREEFIELGNVAVSRDFTYVGDVVEAYQLLLQSDARSIVVNICSGEASSVEQILCFLEQMTNHKMDIRKNSKLIRKNDIELLLGDNTLLKKLTGWAPTHKLDKVLALMINNIQAPH